METAKEQQANGIQAAKRDVGTEKRLQAEKKS
jgi:hypothetical protein